MQKKKNQNGVPLSKEKFVDIIERLREASELVDKVEELFRNSRENIDCDFCNGAALQISHEGVVVDLLQNIGMEIVMMKIKNKENKSGVRIW